ncbi:MAG TPA: PAS domain-containing protein [Candidatus Limnocylindrales bacterium]|nr:PAS domain-containing protein [Candidatus Limnocylindrales bacterium]
MPIPSDDAIFGIRVREVFGDLERLPAGQAASELQSRLRPLHPEVHTSMRSEMAGFGNTQVIYVYRDGWRRQTLTAEWTEDPGAARVVTDAAGTYVDANDAAARLFSVSQAEIIGRPAGSFTRPDTRLGNADDLWRTLERIGRLHSLAIVVRPDGTEAAVEFVTIRDGDGPGRHVTFLRAVVG